MVHAVEGLPPAEGRVHLEPPTEVPRIGQEDVLLVVHEEDPGPHGSFAFRNDVGGFLEPQ